MKYFLLLPAIVLFTLFTIWPLAEVIKMSFLQTNFITSRFVGFQNYIDSFNNPAFIQSAINSGIYIVFLILAQLFLSVTVALAIFRLNKKWQDTSRILLYLPVLSGGIIIAQIWKWIFHIEGLANWILSLFKIAPVNWFGEQITSILIVSVIVAISSFGSNVIIILASALAIDKSIFEAALIDGANKRQIKWRILIPILTPTILLIVLMTMISAMQIFETIYSLVPQEYAATFTYNIYRTAFQFSKYGLSSAQAIMLLIITIFLSFLQRKLQK